MKLLKLEGTQVTGETSGSYAFMQLLDLSRIEDTPISDIVVGLTHSASARWLFDQTAPVRYVYSGQAIRPTVYRPERLIELPNHAPAGQTTFNLIYALKRLHQRPLSPLLFSPEDAILVHRAQTHDALCWAIRVAYELRRSGPYTTPWQWLSNQQHTAAACRVYEVTAQESFRTLNDGAAHRKSYDQLFSMTAKTDKGMIHTMLLDEQHYMMRVENDAALPAEWFRTIGELPGGANYLFRPKSKSFNDATYTTVEDRSNANFLWFIKFERSFHHRDWKQKKQLEEFGQVIPFRGANP